MSKHEPQIVEAPVEHPDAWHRHTPAEGAPQREHGAHENPRILAGAFVVLTIGFIVTVLAVIGYYFNYLTAAKARQIETTVMAGPWEEMRTAVKANIASNIDDAMLAVIDQYSQVRN